MVGVSLLLRLREGTEMRLRLGRFQPEPVCLNLEIPACVRLYFSSLSCFISFSSSPEAAGLRRD